MWYDYHTNYYPNELGGNGVGGPFAQEIVPVWDNWYFKRRHDYFLYENYGDVVFEHEGIGYYRQKPIGENPEFFTKPAAYFPESENNPNYGFIYPEVYFNCAAAPVRKTSWVPNGFVGMEPPGYSPQYIYSGIANGSRITAITEVTACCVGHFGAYIGNREQFFSGNNWQYACVIGKKRLHEGGNDDTTILKIAATPQNASPPPIYPIKPDEPDEPDCTPAQCPAEWDDYYEAMEQWEIDIDAWIIECEEHIAEFYPAVLNDTILAPDMDIKFPWFMPEVEDDEYLDWTTRAEAEPDLPDLLETWIPPSDPTYYDWVRNNCILYTMQQDSCMGISGCKLMGRAASSDGSAKTIKMGTTPYLRNTNVFHKQKYFSQWCSTEKLIGTDSTKQLGILEDYINAMEPADGDSGSPVFTHIPEITGTSPILVGLIGGVGEYGEIGGNCGYMSSYYLPMWDEKIWEYHDDMIELGYNISILEWFTYRSRRITKDQLYAIPQFTDETPISYGGGGSISPFQGEILQWLPLPDARWGISGLDMTTNYDDEPHPDAAHAWHPVPIKPDYEGFHLQWRDEGIFHTISDMIDEVPVFEWEYWSGTDDAGGPYPKFFMGDMKDVSYLWKVGWPEGTTWKTRPKHWDTHNNAGDWLGKEDLVDGGHIPSFGKHKFMWTEDGWRGAQYYSWHFSHFWRGSEEITDPNDPGFSDGQVNHWVQDYWCDYKNRSGLVMTWDETLYGKRQNPDEEDPEGAFVLEPPLNREVDLNADKAELTKDPEEDEHDPMYYSPTHGRYIMPVLGWGEKADGTLGWRLLSPPLESIGVTKFEGKPRAGTVLRFEPNSVWDPNEDEGAWVPNRYNTGEQVWARDTYSVDMSYNKLYRRNFQDNVEPDGTFNLGDDMVRDIYIPNDCTLAGYKIFDFSAAIYNRQSQNTYLEPKYNTAGHSEPHSDHDSFAHMPCSGLPPIGVESNACGNPTVYPQWYKMYFAEWMGDGDGGHFYCRPHDYDAFERVHTQLLYSMKLNIYRVRPNWEDMDTNPDSDTYGESSNSATITTIAEGVAYDDNPGQEWISTSRSLKKGDSIRIELDTSYQEDPSTGDGEYYNEYLVGREAVIMSHPAGLSYEHGNIGWQMPQHLWDVTTLATQTFAKTSFHIKLEDINQLQGVL